MVHIIRGKKDREIFHFFAGGVFYHGEDFVQKFGLDNGDAPAGGSGTAGNFTIRRVILVQNLCKILKIGG